MIHIYKSPSYLSDKISDSNLDKIIQGIGASNPQAPQGASSFNEVNKVYQEFLNKASQYDHLDQEAIRKFFLKIQNLHLTNQDKGRDQQVVLESQLGQILDCFSKQKNEEKECSFFVSIIDSIENYPDLCVEGTSLYLKDSLMLIEVPDLQEPKTALAYYIEQFKVQSIKDLIAAQYGVSIYYKGDESNEELEDHRKRQAILIFSVHPKIQELKGKNPLALEDLSQLLDKETINNIETIFPRKTNESDMKYGQRMQGLANIPLYILLWPMHNGNKEILAQDWLHQELEIDQKNVFYSGLQEALSDNFRAKFLGNEAKDEVLKCLYENYYNSEKFIKYLQNRVNLSPEFSRLSPKMQTDIYTILGENIDPLEDGLIYNGIGKPVITDKGFKFLLDRLVPDWKSNFIPKFKEI